MNIVRFEKIESKILELRGQKVILDSDVAELYGVKTRDINKAVKNNPDKFLLGYILEIPKEEKNELVENFHRFEKLKHSIVNPKAFTEKGLYMLATILKSPQATKTTIAIIETFTKIRNLSRNIKALANTHDASQKRNLLQNSGEIITEIFDNNLASKESETTIELNFAVLKFKHIIKKMTKKQKE